MSSKLRVDQITNANADGPVSFPNGVTGDGSLLRFAPKIVGFSPLALSDDSDLDINIVFTFDQEIMFSGVGTIHIRSGSATGSIHESFTCGVSTRAVISDRNLVIDPTNNLNINTTYFVTLPSVGIADTFDSSFYAGTSSYNFNTKVAPFTLTGGNYQFDQTSGSSPTGYYRYHLFTGTSNFTLGSASSNSSDMVMMMVGGGGAGGFFNTSYLSGGGGGGGGVIKRTGPTALGLSAGTYTMTIGAGGAKYSPSPYNSPGEDTVLTPSSSPGTVHFRAKGGGTGGSGNPTMPAPSMSPFGNYWGKGQNGGSGGGAFSQYNSTNSTPPISVGGAGQPGQGYPGGGNARNSTPNHVPNNGIVGGGGGGAGGAGQRAYTQYPYPQSTNYPTNKYYAGNGGPGLSVPEFPMPYFLAPGVIPESVMPFDAINRLDGSFGGGGGGGSTPNFQYAYRGLGGAGGGGEGAGPQNQSHPSYPTYPGGQSAPSPQGGPYPNSYAQHGAQLTGGGGGAGAGGAHGGTGGSGIAIIRYAVPADLLS